MQSRVAQPQRAITTRRAEVAERLRYTLQRCQQLGHAPDNIQCKLCQHLRNDCGENEGQMDAVLRGEHEVSG